MLILTDAATELRLVGLIRRLPRACPDVVHVGVSQI